MLYFIAESEDSLSATLGLQLIGDWLKINSWVMAYTMVSHSMTRIFILTEVCFALLLAFSTVLMARHFDLLGTAAAYALTYAAYWMVMAVVCRSLVSRLRRRAVSAEHRLPNRRCS